MITTEELVLELNNTEESKNFKLATVVDLFENETAKIQFDGEDTPSEKQFAYLKSYMPEIGDRILLAALGGTYIILGRVNYNESPVIEEEFDRYVFDLKAVTILKGLAVSGDLTINHGATIVGNVGVNGSVTATGLSSTGAITGASINVTGQVKGGAGEFTGLDVSGAANLKSTLTVTRTLIADSTFRHRGSNLGFFNYAATNQRQVPYYLAGGGTPTVDGLRTKLNDLIGALAAYGLIRT